MLLAYLISVRMRYICICTHSLNNGNALTAHFNKTFALCICVCEHLLSDAGSS